MWMTKQVVVWYPAGFEKDVGQGNPETTRRLLCAFCSILFYDLDRLIPRDRILSVVSSLPSLLHLPRLTLSPRLMRSSSESQIPSSASPRTCLSSLETNRKAFTRVNARSTPLHLTPFILRARPISTNGWHSSKATMTSARPRRFVSSRISTVVQTQPYHHRCPRRRRSLLGVSVAQRRSFLPRRTTHPPHTVPISLPSYVFSIFTIR